MTQYNYMNLIPKDSSQRPVFVDGLRTPFVKSFGEYADCDSLQLTSSCVDQLIRKTAIDPEMIQEISVGVVIPQTKNANVARDAILNLGLPNHIHGYTLNRACTSGLQTVTNAAKAIRCGHSDVVLAGGVECLSDVPIVYSKKARKMLTKFTKAKTPQQKLSLLKDFHFKDWVPNPPGLTEPLTGLSMGESAEIMSQINGVSREEQDAFALASHQKAINAMENGYFDDEVFTFYPQKGFSAVEKDNIARADTSLESLAKLRPAFDKKYGTITAGNASPMTDGASMTLITDEKAASRLGLNAKSRIVDSLYLGVNPYEQLLIGPAVAIPLILKKNELTMDDIDLVEIHEAFAAQVLCCVKSMKSKEFCEKYFGQEIAPIDLPMEKLNVNGGAVAIGHPFGATGGRLLTTITNELIRQGKKRGLVAVCAAGGMAGAMIVETL